MKSARIFLMTGAAVLAIAWHVRAAEREFKDVVRAISDEFQTRPLHIPMFGLANVVLKFAHPAGAKHVDLAIFQNLDRDRTDRNLVQRLKFAIGREWQPFVQVHNERGRDAQDTLTYMREAGRNDINLLVVTIQGEQVVVVEAKVDPSELQRWIDSPTESARRWGHFGRDDRDLDN